MSSNVLISDVVNTAGALVVNDDSQAILGIITESDTARRLKTFGRNVVDRPVDDFMTRKVRTCQVGQDEDRRRSHEAGFDRHTVKPVDIQAPMSMIAVLNVGRVDQPTNGFN